MKVILGTSNDFKLRLLEKCLSELEVEAEVLGLNVSSGVSDQPIGSNVTKRGAVNRAKTAWSKGCDFSVGLEVGYTKRKDGLYEMICWAAVYDGNELYSAQSHGLLLPKFHQEIMRQGKYLGDHVRDYNPAQAGKPGELLRDIIIFREPFLKTAAFNALIRYFSRHDY